MSGIRLRKSELKRLIEGFLFDTEYSDGDYTYKRSSDAKYGWVYKVKDDPVWKPVNKAGAKKLDKDYGESSDEEELEPSAKPSKATGVTHLPCIPVSYTHLTLPTICSV